MRPAGHHVALVHGVRTVTLSVRGLRPGRWRAVVATLPPGGRRTITFSITR